MVVLEWHNALHMICCLLNIMLDTECCYIVGEKTCKNFVWSGWGSVCQPYIESAAAFSDNYIAMNVIVVLV